MDPASLTTQAIVAFLGYFVLGLAVNLTPCVYPLLTVTAALFRRKDTPEAGMRASFLKALSYFLGVTVMYSLLGYFAAVTGKLFGAVLQNHWVLFAISLMMFFLALSMFGVFKIGMPSWLLNRLGGLRKVNYAGLFLSGMFVGIFAAPCIGPPVIALLTTVTERGDPLFGLSAFFVFSMGLGLPYLVLGTFSGLLSKLPKGGGWLVWIEHAFGIILFGFGAFYLTIAFKVEWVRWVWPVAMLLGGGYLALIERAGSEKVSFRHFSRGIAVMVILAGALATYRTVNIGNEKIVWQPYSEKALSVALSQRRSVVIDFYADWCIACQEAEQAVFPNKEVRQRIADSVALRVDATHMEDPDVQKAVERWQVIGLPTMVFPDRQGNEIDEARIEGSISVKELLQSLEIAQL